MPDYWTEAMNAVLEQGMGAEALGAGATRICDAVGKWWRELMMFGHSSDVVI